MRGGGAADGVDGGVVLIEQGVAGDDGQGRAGGLSDLAGDGLYLQRPHVGGGCVDHLARQGGGGGDVQGLGQIEPGGGDQTGATALGPGLVAVEQIPAEGEGQSRLPGRITLDAVEAPVAGGQAGRQRSGAHRLEDFARAEQGLARRAVVAGDDQQLTRLAGEAVGLGPGGLLAGQPLPTLDHAHRAGGVGGGDQQVGVCDGHGASLSGP
ncbi:hypothetical protein D3C85_1139780 [compost metagenome]